jgi:exonuclease III
MKVLN